MARELGRTVVLDGETFAVGTKETADLKSKIPNAKAWVETEKPAAKSADK